MSDTDLSGLDVVADDQQAVKTHRMNVQRIANHTLSTGLETTDKTQVNIDKFYNICIIKNLDSRNAILLSAL